VTGADTKTPGVQQAPGEHGPPGDPQPADAAAVLSHAADAEALLRRCSFPEGDSGLALGVSGGADSTAMALLAAASGASFVIWHVDHGLRPSSLQDAEVVRTLAERLGVPFELRRVAIEAGAGLEARAREARYEALPGNVCVAHTADDQAETVLFNLLRGAGPAGAAARMSRVSRPLLGLRRHETRALCAATGIETVQDPFNADADFTRVAVRERLLPLIAEIFERDPVPLLTRHARLVGEALDVVAKQACAVDPTDTAALAAVQPAVASEALRSWLRCELDTPLNVDAASIERVLAVARGLHSATEIEGGHRVARSAGRLRLEPKAR